MAAAYGAMLVCYVSVDRLKAMNLIFLTCLKKRIQKKSQLLKITKKLLKRDKNC